MDNNFTFLEFSSTEQLDRSLSRRIEKTLSRSLKDNSKASLVVSGGRSPKGFFKLLSKTQIDWAKTLVTLADDRWVDISHEDSNEKLVKELMLINNAESAQFISLKTENDSVSDGVMELEHSFPMISSFSLVILGMGTDGHTASLFPNTDSLRQGIDINSCKQFIASKPTDAPHMRISMTASRLLAADEIIVHITGAKKRKILDKALAGTDATEIPIRIILNQTEVPVTVFWSP